MSKILKLGMAITALSAGLGTLPVSANEVGANGTGTIPVNITVEATPINVTVPTSIDIAVAADSVNGVIADTNTITNNANAGVVLVDSIKATPVAEEGWTLQDSAFDFANAKKDSKNIYVGSKLGTDASFASLKTEYKPTDKEIAPKANKKVSFETKTNAVSTKVDNKKIANITVTISQK